MTSSRANQRWIPVYPKAHNPDHPEKTRALLLVNRNIATDTWTRLDVDSPDVAAIRIETERGSIRIFCIYNDCTHNRSMNAVRNYLSSREGRRTGGRDNEDVWAGDFNRHHEMWDEGRNKHLFTRANTEAAEELLEAVAENGMEMILAAGTPTLRAFGTGNLTRPDNVFVSGGLTHAVDECRVIPEEAPPKTDHFPIQTVINAETKRAEVVKGRNFREVDWVKFGEEVEMRMRGRSTEEITTADELNERLDNLVDALQKTIENKVPEKKQSPHMKRWTPKGLSGRHGWKTSMRGAS
ncbi:hypothetical protein D9615_004831 [Tricholomella constricta]|uniref:Endonuclease/exonuclease/phosphatase domain-containing protein n=1 Tax=Tricholomella constricta TaxID=117010 RepID=A0A8H5M6J7_9AGAR|nr:hypothetical protein D9615_004831 [Tricholomella constricta]